MTRPAFWLIVSLWLSGPGVLWADTGRGGALLLRQSFGARPFALGQAYSALGDDAFGLSYNPAILSRLKDTQLATEYTRSLVGARLGFATLATPLSPDQAFGVGVAYMDLGTAELFDDAGRNVGRVNVQRDLMLDLGYARSFSPGSARLRAGAAVKLFRSVIADQAQASAYAGDFGTLYERPLGPGRVSLGLAVSNAGRGVRYSGGSAGGSEQDPLPLTARFGLAYSRPAFRGDTFHLSAQVERLVHDEALSQALGAEYEYHQAFTLRAGYRRGAATTLSVGIGYRLRSLSIDYGLGIIQAFNNIQQLSLNYRFLIPGIRYGRDAESGLERLLDLTDRHVASGDYFEAADALDRVQTVAPDSGLLYRKRIQAEIQQVLDAVPRSPRFNYAMGFRLYQERRWDDAVAYLDAALRAEPSSREIRKFLGRAVGQRDDQNRQMTLHQQATMGRLFELADQAYRQKDHARAERILDEILRVGPYGPARSLKERLAADRRPAPQAPAPPSPAPAPPPTARVSPENAARAERLYYDAVRRFAEGDLDGALRDLREGLALNPESKPLKVTLEQMEKELNGRKADTSEGSR